MQSFIAGGAPLWARYTALAPGVNVPVNILVFNTGTAYQSLTLTTDPVGASLPLSTCTPFTTQTDYFGTAAGMMLRQCNEVGTHLIGAQFIRGDTFEQAVRGDNVSCSSPVQVVWGDHNCSDDADPVDSLFNLRHDAGLSTDTGDCPDMGEEVTINGVPRIWGDADCSGEADPIDGLKILRHDAGLEVDQEPGCPEIGELVSLE